MQRGIRLTAYALIGGLAALLGLFFVVLGVQSAFTQGLDGLVLTAFALGAGALVAGWFALRKWLQIRDAPPVPAAPAPVENSKKEEGVDEGLFAVLYFLLLFGPATLNFFLSLQMGYPLSMALGGAFFLLMWGFVVLRQFQAGTNVSYWLVLTVIYFLPALLPLLLGPAGPTRP